MGQARGDGADGAGEPNIYRRRHGWRVSRCRRGSPYYFDETFPTLAEARAALAALPPIPPRRERALSGSLVRGGAESSEKQRAAKLARRLALLKKRHALLTGRVYVPEEGPDGEASDDEPKELFFGETTSDDERKRDR